MTKKAVLRHPRRSVQEALDRHRALPQNMPVTSIRTSWPSTNCIGEVISLRSWLDCASGTPGAGPPPRRQWFYKVPFYKAPGTFGAFAMWRDDGIGCDLGEGHRCSVTRGPRAANLIVRPRPL